MSVAWLILRYAFFAAIATVANLALQRLVMGAAPTTFGYIAGVVLGTAVGLAVKFVLDKYYIFSDRSLEWGRTSRSFMLYSAMGIVTTLLFWAVETGFWMYWRTETMREAGAVLGLAIGYVVKYCLDRRFVFADAGAAAARG